MANPDPFIGREILNGAFRILEKIGTGGMGSVYRANQTAMNRMVAVKILHPKLANRKDLVSRFRREAKAMSHLSHPNTVKVLLYGELEDGSLYIVMEYLEGKNLNQTVRTEGPLTVERALPILIQVCGALEEAHRAGIIHRDLKPENIFLCNQGGLRDFPKVLDFGLAKVTEREMRPGSIILTQEGMVFGTPEFMSPEQAQGTIAHAGQRHLFAGGHSVRGAHGEAPVRRAYAGRIHPAPRHRAPDSPRPIASPAKLFLPGSGEVIAQGAREEARRPLPVRGRVRCGAQAVRGSGTMGIAVSCRRRSFPGFRCRRPFRGSTPTPKGRSSGLGLIVGVAAACLVMGVVLAVTVMRFLH